ncbi:MAG: hypothetical protein DMF79_18870 [Acidobacteria bacterium]|nr:MAG: hypothetical protein DMF79_18870 [Acidobacteriota bacterium]
MNFRGRRPPPRRISRTFVPESSSRLAWSWGHVRGEARLSQAWQKKVGSNLRGVTPISSAEKLSKISWDSYGP